MKSSHPQLDRTDPRTCIASKIMKSHRIINGIFRKHLKDFGLTNSQMSILFILSKRGRLKQHVLSEILYLEKSSVSRNMKRLFENELVSRQDFPVIEITEKGLELLESIIPHWNAAMEETRSKLGESGEAGLDMMLTNLTQ